MSEELKQFFNKIKNSQDLFLLWKLYKNPSSVIGNKQDMDEAEEEYYNLYDYCRLMMNNNLTEFIQLILYDSNFLGKEDIQTWRKLGFFLYDSADFKVYYHMLDDPDLLPLFRNDITIQEYIKRKGSFQPKFPLLEMYNAYQKYKKLFKYHYPKEQIDNYDEKKAAHVRSMINLRLNVIRERTIEREENKKIAMKQVEEDDYSNDADLDNTFLYKYQLFTDFWELYSLFPNLCMKTFDNLVCENKFLDIIEHKLDKGKIDGIPLDNALDIINMGINIKKFIISDWEMLAGRLGMDLVRNFDLHHAESLVSKITLYRIQNSRKFRKIKQFSKR